jgi:hypothetical protein
VLDRNNNTNPIVVVLIFFFNESFILTSVCHMIVSCCISLWPLHLNIVFEITISIGVLEDIYIYIYTYTY